MERTEIAVWAEPGEPIRRGVVRQRGGVRAAVLVRWESGRESPVKSKDPYVKYAFEDTRRLDWLLRPGLLHEQLIRDPLSVMLDVIRDEGAPITTATIKKRLVEFGVDGAEVDLRLKALRPTLKQHPHLVSEGSRFAWSDAIVDHHKHLRDLDPHQALERLLESSKLKDLGEKEALADAIRSGFKNP